MQSAAQHKKHRNAHHSETVQHKSRDKQNPQNVVEEHRVSNSATLKKNPSYWDTIFLCRQVNMMKSHNFAIYASEI